jgi:DNA polymerase III epsilon subunit-like protein
VQAHLAGRLVGIYNEDFDMRMMKQTHTRLGMRWPANQGFSTFCIMKLFAEYRGEWDYRRGGYRWHSLENAGRLCNIPLPNSHRASDDSRLARAVLHHMARGA